MRAFLVAIGGLAWSSVVSAAWVVNGDTSPMDGKLTVYIASVSTKKVPDSFGRTVAPRLVIRCASGKADLIFDAEMVMQSVELYVTAMRLKFDDAAPVRIRAQESTDYKAAFIGDPRGQIARIRGAQKVLVEFTPHASGDRIAEFDVAGLDKYDGLLEQHCKIRPAPPAAKGKRP